MFFKTKRIPKKVDLFITEQKRRNGCKKKRTLFPSKMMEKAFFRWKSLQISVSIRFLSALLHLNHSASYSINSRVCPIFFFPKETFVKNAFLRRGKSAANNKNLFIGKELSVTGGAVSTPRPLCSASPQKPFILGCAPVAIRIPKQ